MREILFRGKRLDNGEWVYGYLARFRNFRNKVYTSIIQINDFETQECNIQDNSCVFTETVGQFTGLKDKNGKKIFEGDIVKDWDGRIYEIKYFDFEWIAEQTKSFWININDLKPCEVIGNIYDNTELLEAD